LHKQQHRQARQEGAQIEEGLRSSLFQSLINSRR
jgi:hypothetical protein